MEENKLEKYNEFIENYRNAHVGLRRAEQDMASVRREIIEMFRQKMNSMISNTPTGETRNDITDLNIVFELLIGTL